ncbi:MAG: hypothetical protein OET90_02595 [Desulfuromonadales bacterium]|nr:hypothetical protein [Desulfuromonadales bacterium]
MCCSDTLIAAQLYDDTEGYKEGVANGDIQYLALGSVVDRPVMPIVVTEQTLSGVPTGADMYVDCEWVATVDGSDIEFVPDAAGVYSLRFVLFPYQRCEVEIDAN